jgi:hypothetical protein
MKIETCLLYTFYVVYILLLAEYTSFTEWSIHYFPMHQKRFKKVPLLRFLTLQHLPHHRDYTPTHYACFDKSHKHKNLMIEHMFGILIAVINAIPFLILELKTNFDYNLTIICVLFGFLYYFLFELFHHALHEGLSWQRKLLGHFGVFRYIFNYHKVHHGKFKKNLNLVFPLADYFIGTKDGVSQFSVWKVRVVTVSVVFVFVGLFVHLQSQ